MHSRSTAYRGRKYAETGRSLWCHRASKLAALGCLDTLPTGEVLDAERNVIPGLFAAGRTACGLPRWGEGYSSGLSLADATFFGRQAGRRAARTLR